MPKIKLCGVTSLRDAKMCVDEGADYLGFIFASVSPRRVSPGLAKRILKSLPRGVIGVGVFMNQELDEVRGTLSDTGLAMAQLHGNESAAFVQKVGRPVIKVFDTFSKRALGRLSRYDVYAYMLDLPKSQPGADAVDAPFAVNAKVYGKVFISGKLTPENVVAPIREIRPFGVDCCSATEKAPGRKDRSRVRAFVEAVRRASKEPVLA
jgi:phosphoribosylanthranilate isomerase